jgi:predicted enzyme related to lactoylglutathione lyase
MVKLRKINVVFTYVVDIDQAREFYGETLGLGAPSIKTPGWVEFQLEEGSHLAFKKTEAENLEGCDPARNTVRFSIVVDDLAAAYEELTAKGVRFIRPPEKGHGFDLAEFEDPERNQIRLLQYTTMKRSN